MNTKSLLILGSGRHGQIVAEAADLGGEFRVLGFADDDPLKVGRKFGPWETLGGWRDVAADAYIVAVGKNGDRERLFKLLQEAGKNIATVVSPHAVVSNQAEIGAGSVILAGAVVQMGAKIGRNCILNAGAVVDHDAVLEDHCHVAPNATVLSYGRVLSGEILPAGSVRARV